MSHPNFSPAPIADIKFPHLRETAQAAGLKLRERATEAVHFGFGLLIGFAAILVVMLAVVAIALLSR